MDISTFQFSTNAISQRKKILYLLQWLLPVVCGIFVLVFTRMRDMTGALIVFIAITIVFEIELFFVSMYVIKKLQNTKFSVTSQFIERSVGRSVERINFNEIKSLKIVENLVEHLIVITISSHKASMVLFGVNDIEVLLDKIENAIVDKSIIHRRNSKFVTYNLTYQLIWMGTGAGIVILMFYLGDTVYINFVLVTFLVSGLFMMIYRPFTRFLGSYRILEVAVGFLFVFFSFALIYLLYIR